MDAATRPMAPLALTQAARAPGLLAAIGASIAMAAWSLAAGPALADYVARNQIDPAARAALARLLVTGALAGAGAGAALAAASREHGLA